MDKTWKRKRTMILGTWNVRSLTGKEEELVEEMEKYGVDLLAVTETKKKGNGTLLLGRSKHMFYSGVSIGQRAATGVALIVSNKWMDNIEAWSFKSERLISVDMILEKEKTRIIVAYAPNENAPQHEKDKFFEDAQELIDEVQNKREIIIMGDLNARVGKDIELAANVIGPEGEETLSENGEYLIDLCVRNNLKITNTFFPHKEIHKITRTEESKQEKSIIDYIIVSNKLMRNVLDTRVKRGAEIFSDHRLLVSKLRFRPPTKFKNKKRTKILISKLRNQLEREQYGKDLKNNISNMPWQDETTIEEKWNIYKNLILTSAEKICGRAVIGGGQKSTPWWTDTVRNVVKQKKEAWKKYLNSKRDEDKNIYLQRRDEAKLKVREAKQKSWADFGNKMEENYNDNRKLFWRVVKRLRNDKPCPLRKLKTTDGKIIHERREVEKTWVEHFKDLFSLSLDDDLETEEIQRETNEGIDEEDAEIDTLEFLNAKKKIKIGKAAGGDNIAPEMIKYQGAEADSLLLGIMNQAWEEKRVPKGWKEAIIVPIHKKGSTSICANYRGISLLSVPGKIYSRILDNRIRREVEHKLGEHQSGFRPGRSVQDHIFSLRQIIEKIIEYDKDLHVGFIDLTKAFDTIPRTHLWKAMDHFEVSKQLQQAIKSFYIHSKARVRIDGQTTEIFDTKRGVRQGCIMSPFLFIMIMDYVTSKCLHKFNEVNLGMWRLQPVRINLLSYADDLVIFGKNQETLQNNLNILNQELINVGMHINENKTKTMIISRKRKEHNLTLNNKTVEQVNIFKYLGAYFTEDGKIQEEIRNRIKNATRIYGYLGRSIIGKQEMSLETKTAVYNAIYCPTLQYSSESWVMSDREKSQIQAAEMKFLRRSIGKTRRDRIRNERMREILKVDKLQDKIDTGQLRWFGHLLRMDESRIARRIFEARTSARRPRGRPRKTWVQQVEATLRTRGIDKNARKISQDRVKWKNAIQHERPRHP